MKTYENQRMSIKRWAEEDRPREKLLLQGRKGPSDAELLSILIGTGSRKESALSLAKKVLGSVEGSLDELGKRTVTDLCRFRGIGEAKAVTIVAALELGRRRQMTDIRERPQIRSSKDAYQLIAPYLLDLPHEEFWILLLNRANRVVGRTCISQGGVSGTVVDGKILFRKALEGGACSIILCHNHPSGNLKPSQADIEITRKLRSAGDMLDIQVLDHLIFAGRHFFSFADEGFM